MRKEEFTSKILATIVEKIPELGNVRTLLEEKFNHFQKEDLKEILNAIAPEKKET